MFVAFIAMSMFIAIVDSAFDDVRSEMAKVSLQVLQLKYIVYLICAFPRLIRLMKIMKVEMTIQG